MKVPEASLIPELHKRLPAIYELTKNPLVWDSLIVNRRKPFTYRVFTQLDGYRICLHKFDPCDTHESFPHPHPWPGAFLILAGSYRMWLGKSADLIGEPESVTNLILTSGSSYEITDPTVFHAITPLAPTYTIMINSKTWLTTERHESTVTTAGKDLDKMPVDELKEHLKIFNGLLAFSTSDYQC